MFLGRVAGTVWSTVKWPQAQGLKLLLVRPYRLGDLAPGVAAVAPGVAAAAPGVVTAAAGGTASEPTDDLVVCADTLDAGPGDDVIVAFGHAARVAVSEKLAPGSKPMVPIDAAVVAVVDRVEIPR
jgi:microcompartment protein CcmK/EutM